jgi:quercetin dioxygenase-like cupin family protein
MKVLGAGPAARADRPASALLHDEPNGRVVAFHLLPGQRVPPHHSTSTVIVQVVAGSGRFHGAETDAVLSAGECAVFSPGETHAIDAGDESLHFHVFITPRPGA